MKSGRVLLRLAVLLLLPLFALAETAADVTGECTLSFRGGVQRHLTDRDHTSACTLPEARNHYVTVTPGDTPVASLYLVMGTHQMPFTVQRQTEDGAWVDITDRRAEGHHQEYVSFEPQSGTFRLWFHRPDNEPTVLDLRELYLLSEGEAPGGQIHDWEYTTEKADLLVIAAHPDDELLWFGGLIPYYAAEKKLSVQVCYMTCESATRHLELLDGLWECGVRRYPAVGRLPDIYTETLEEGLKAWGENKTVRTVVSWLRLYRPEVVVTHDLKGEYGHGAHRATSKAVEIAAGQAAAPEYDGGSLSLGAYQVKKVYRHLGEEPTTRMDWSKPIAALNGRSGFQVAEDAFAWHKSQTKKNRYSVALPGEKNDSTLYTLIFSTVGEDESGDDLFEHITNGETSEE